MPCILYILTYLLISVSESDSLIVLYNANRMYGTFLVNSSCHGIVMNIETKVGVTEKNVPANPYSSSLAGIVVEPSNYVPVSKTYQNRSTRKDTGAKKKKSKGECNANLPSCWPCHLFMILQNRASSWSFDVSKPQLSDPSSDSSSAGLSAGNLENCLFRFSESEAGIWCSPKSRHLYTCLTCMEVFWGNNKVVNRWSSSIALLLLATHTPTLRVMQSGNV